MATFVLVPGAWLGGWVWRDVTRLLRRAGHDVFPVTLTGLGERVHLARPDIDLETHITDVIDLLCWNELDDVILAGHSYAGAVVTGVADRVPERIGQLVYVDSAPFTDGLALIDLFSPERRRDLEHVVTTMGEGWRVPFPGGAHLGEFGGTAGIDAKGLAWMEAFATPQPWATFTQPLQLQGGEGGAYAKVLIACDDMLGAIAAGVPPLVAMTAAPWRFHELRTGHWPMVSAPGELASILTGLVAD
ncbi:MAG: alpha/beta hydrolase [Thermomicrobiales bacterium]